MTKPKPMERTSQKITEEQKAKLRQLFPEVFTEGKIDFDRLKLTLGEEADDGAERYGMSWPGKRECFKVIQQPSAGTLKPCKAESVNFDDTENLFIEGDNLEVLKLLQKSCYGKVKMIYIDPPYNTGKEFIYPDSFKENLGTYLEYTGQTDESGKKFSTNTEAEGRFHSKWLNMMYPRLFLARNLLRDDGVIFISIDDNEVSNLRKLCDEVFGEENFVSAITLLCNPKGRNQDKYFATNHEYILVYSKATLPKGFFSIAKGEEQVEAEYPEEDEGGKYRLLELRNTHREFGRHNRKNLFYPFYVDDTGGISLKKTDGFYKVLPLWDDGFEGCWTWDGTKAEKDIDLLVAQQVGGRWKIYRKSYASGADRMLKTILIDRAFYTEKGQKEFNGLFGTKAKIFQSPKSPDLLAQLFLTVTSANDIILDFFAGSATTAHAVLELNKEDGGNRKFIMVQLPEPCAEESEAFKAGYKTIAEIGKERIRRVIKKMEEEAQLRINAKERESKQTNLFADSEISENSRPFAVQTPGFKVFKLDRSNFKAWQAEATDGITAEAIAQQLELGVDHIDPKSTPDDILYELLIKSGFELTAKVETLKLANKTVYSIAGGALLICLEDALTKEVITAMAKMSPARVICLDRGFAGNDQLKTNAVQIMKSHEVEDFRTV